MPHRDLVLDQLLPEPSIGDVALKDHMGHHAVPQDCAFIAVAALPDDHLIPFLRGIDPEGKGGQSIEIHGVFHPIGVFIRDLGTAHILCGGLTLLHGIGPDAGDPSDVARRPDIFDVGAQITVDLNRAAGLDPAALKEADRRTHACRHHDEITGQNCTALERNRNNVALRVDLGACGFLSKIEGASRFAE